MIRLQRQLEAKPAGGPEFVFDDETLDNFRSGSTGVGNRYQTAYAQGDPRDSKALIFITLDWLSVSARRDGAFRREMENARERIHQSGVDAPDYYVRDCLMQSKRFKGFGMATRSGIYKSDVSPGSKSAGCDQRQAADLTACGCGKPDLQFARGTPPCSLASG